MFHCLLAGAARAVPDGAWRREAVAVAQQAAAEQGTFGRGVEVASLLGFGLRQRSWRATRGSARPTWSQGTTLGAVLLLATALAHLLALLTGPAAGATQPSVAGAAGDVAAWGAAVSLAVALVGACRGRLLVAGSMASVGLVASVAVGVGEAWHPAISAQAVGLIALSAALLAAPRQTAGSALARRPRRRTTVAVPGGRAWLTLFVPVSVAVPLVGPAATAGVTGAATLLIPAALLVLGGADPRLAAAAAVAWGWRFLALDPTDVVDAVVALATHEGIDVILARLAVMASAVAVAVTVALRSTRRVAAL